MIKLFITGEDPRSLRTVELDNWWGLAVMGRTPYFKRALEREELTRSCVYLLVKSASEDDIPEVYVGESDDFTERYAAGKFPIDFDTFIVFTNKDENLTRARVKWLEREVWQLLTDNEGKVRVANRATPTGSKLPEAERASMMTFLGNMVYVVEALGFEFFGYEEEAQATLEPRAPMPRPSSAIGSYSTTAMPKSSEPRAFLDIVDGSYVLKAGSHLSKIATESLPSNVKKLRDKLLSEGSLIDAGATLKLEKDITFSKPSPASALVKGRSSSGNLDWTRVSDQKRLGDVLLS